MWRTRQFHPLKNSEFNGENQAHTSNHNKCNKSWNRSMYIVLNKHYVIKVDVCFCWWGVWGGIGDCQEGACWREGVRYLFWRKTSFKGNTFVKEIPEEKVNRYKYRNQNKHAWKQPIKRNQNDQGYENSLVWKEQMITCTVGQELAHNESCNDKIIGNSWIKDSKY